MLVFQTLFLLCSYFCPVDFLRVPRRNKFHNGGHDNSAVFDNLTMNNDPADDRAKSRKRVGAPRELEQRRATLPDPSRGGTRGYIRSGFVSRQMLTNHLSIAGKMIGLSHIA